MSRAQRTGGVIHASVNDFAVARRHAVADAGGLFRNNDIMTGERGLSCDTKAYYSGSYHEDLHRVSLPILAAYPTMRGKGDGAFAVQGIRNSDG